ncbi:hypothetical protein OHA77_13835 [Streptosporangium sp. NBC_01639]|uniref:hypothetical protein n=1 Tax=Streptosporangium sp. NBC_01639 TaxID=2975948 RepID=UPI00386B1EF1|nr:hypothetical protein OHA77_13835 [Streptosporangium sp. NBC_01639]
MLALLETAPWVGRSVNPARSEGNLLVIPFGESGLVTYLVVEPQREVCILRVQWL